MHAIVVATEALASGQLTRRELARDYRPLFRNVHVRNGAVLTAPDKAIAAWLWSGRTATVGGPSAAALLGSRFVDASLPVELIRANRRAPAGISIRSDDLSGCDVTRIEAVCVTTPARTAFDIGRHHGIVSAVKLIDALLNVTDCSVDDVYAVAERNPGVRGVRQAKAALAFADAGSESPPETLTRLVLVGAGLPPPVTQIRVRVGRAAYRLDMGWPDAMVAVEYDGEQHWTDPRQRARDIERLENLAAAGWTIIRVSWTQLRDNPHIVVARVATALRIAPTVQISHASLASCVQRVHARRGS